MLLALTRRGNYTGRERIKGEAAVHGSQKKGSKGITGGGNGVLARACEIVLSIKLQGVGRNIDIFE